MPSISILEQKKQIVADLAESMKNSVAGVLVDYKGITVEDDTKLRRELREAGVEYAVVKNNLVRLAAREIGFDAFDEFLHGTTALAYSTNEDVVAPAKVLSEFAKTHPDYKVKVGFLEGKVISADEVDALAKLPSKEGLIGQVLYGFNFPISGFAIALNAIREKMEENGIENVAEAVVATAE